MSNFNQSFSDNDALFEIVRRMSEREAEERRKKKKASEEAIKKLPIIKIEKQHCKKQKAGKLEPPSCTICTETINVGSKGMFMPCGHVYHPDCLRPWLE